MITWRPVALFAACLLTLPLWPWPYVGLLVMLVITVGISVTDAVLAASPGNVTMWRTGDSVTRLGGTVTVTLHVRNDGGQAITGRVRDAWTPSAGAHGEEYALTLPPGATAKLATTLTPTRRGDRPSARVTIRSYGPLGFAYRQTPHKAARLATPQWKIRVLPPFHARKHLSEKLARLRVIEGAVAVRGRGQGTEFDALREYVAGDDVRSIDWRATARRQSIVVKTWRVERDRRVLSVIDTGRTSAVRVGDEPRLDAQIEACLLLSTVASYAGDRVDALAVDTEVRAAVESGSGKTVMPRLIRAMAPLQPALVETDFGLVVSEVLRRESKRALVVLFTSLEPGAITESLLPALPQLAARHKIIVATVADPEVARLRSSRSEMLDIYRAAAAEQSLVERRKVAAALARHDVEVIDAPADQFAPAVVDKYLMLKTTGGL
ncbi:DUF58 domain-containing protein [Stackebrandtia nassauensis]|uniref:DUF58 domain-containing protein n=1 Tax=Stackebrandtia nassauensis (strain DSM 44728 / CIP 108903 / NRRL B-16338 / NBRC 102104 / LLR-40K-21) TaxID=446470 RepID=D3PYH3_STANL|nr:DUF58 domain-containing protein [Stackebrandtia nassauensis]ADD41540.1 protein of unknown function DUF58 [Stackebrandtia nassauensis DSM 44728]